MALPQPLKFDHNDSGHARGLFRYRSAGLIPALDSACLAACLGPTAVSCSHCEDLTCWRNCAGNNTRTTRCLRNCM